jgi:hypothetical protein
MDTGAGRNYYSGSELDSLLSSFFGDTSDLSVDRRTRFGKAVNEAFQNNPADASSGYGPGSYDASQTATPMDTSKAGGDSSAFLIRDIPTSSTNYSRPRTVAAGYDPYRQVMTVVFRDGTFYNYYEVTPSEWEAFHASYSKGKPWLNPKNSKQGFDGLFLSKPRGDAGDMSAVDPEIRAALWRVAKSWQETTKPKPGRTYQTVEGMKVRNNLKPRAAKAHKAHTNPATANKPPRRKAS